jgi:uncharacterized protein (TIGR03118 family)
MITLRHLVIAGCLALIAGAPGSVRADFFVQTNLVSNVPGLAAFTDANLRNPWGISSSPTSPFWVSNQVSGNATLYNSAGSPQALVVTIQSAAGGGPTGQVFNSTSDFVLPTGGKALFIFANLDGSISAWNGAQGTTALLTVTPSVTASYTGLTLATNASGNFLIAANSWANTIDVYDGMFAPTSLSGSFVDPGLSNGFSVYNVQQLGGTLFVTYENETDGGGIVDAFDLNGNFLRRISDNDSSGPLKSPWGLALAPAGFGPFGGALLVGNEDDGHISAFDPTTGDFLGQILDRNGDPIANTGLWGLKFGNGGNGGDPNTLYFAAGINDEQDGLFGSIRVAAPEPGSIVLCCIGGTLMVGAYRRRQRRV